MKASEWSQMVSQAGTLNNASSGSLDSSASSGAPLAQAANRNLTPQFTAMSNMVGSNSPSPALMTHSRGAAKGVMPEQLDLLNFHHIVSQKCGLHPSTAARVYDATVELLSTYNDHMRQLRILNSQQYIHLQGAEAQIGRLKADCRSLVQRIEETVQALRSQTAAREALQQNNADAIAKLELLAQEYEEKENRRIADIKHLEATNAELVNRIKVLEQQLTSKQSFWPEHHPNSTSRGQTGPAADPLATPTGKPEAKLSNQLVRYDPHRSQAQQAAQSPRLVSLPVSQPGRKTSQRAAHWGSSSLLSVRESSYAAGNRSEIFPLAGPKARTATPRSRASAMTSAPSNVTDSNLLAAELAEGMSLVFGLIAGWTKSYTSEPSEQEDTALVTANDGQLWHFMMGLCTQQRYDTYSHARLMISDPTLRPWFVMRMIAEYIKNTMWVQEAFYGFDESTQEQLTTVARKLAESKGLNMADRHELLTTQARVVRSIIDHKEYAGFRAERVEHHSKQLRSILGPLLNLDACRADAGRDIKVFVVKTWDIAVKMFSSDCSFQVIYPDTQGRFHASHMVCLDEYYLNVEPKELQMSQARLRFFVTPLITMRNDGSFTIMAKCVQKARVLVE